MSRYGTLPAVAAEVVVVTQGEPMERLLVMVDGEISIEQIHRGTRDAYSAWPLADGRAHRYTQPLGDAAVMQSDSELGELFMREFILRRVELLATTSGDAIVLGSSASSGTH